MEPLFTMIRSPRSPSWSNAASKFKSGAWGGGDPQVLPLVRKAFGGYQDQEGNSPAPIRNAYKGAARQKGQ
jgi:hypothetical protein